MIQNIIDSVYEQVKDTTTLSPIKEAITTAIEASGMHFNEETITHILDEVLYKLA